MKTSLPGFIAQPDHTAIDLETIFPDMGKIRLSFMPDAYTRSLYAYVITFDPLGYGSFRLFPCTTPRYGGQVQILFGILAEKTYLPDQ